jgi:serine/threonine protein kinase
VEREQAALATLAAGHFPELALDDRVAPALAVDPELAALERPGRTLAMYTEEAWPEATAPGNSRHEVKLYSFEGELCVLKAHPLGVASNARELKRQVCLLARLNHPNVAPLRALIYDANKSTAYLETPYFANGPLHRYLARPEVAAPRLPSPHAAVLDRSSERCASGALACLHQLASGLTALHALNAVHGQQHNPPKLINRKHTHACTPPPPTLPTALVFLG